ncbi:MAG: anthranilate synthase component I family protein, partial [Candidatus Omnitrophica bacterium]|nr:anthranilate synthase component I family protein [Candidatus Omnitrophota bacterium]
KKYRIGNHSQIDFLLGGTVGFFGYELVALFEKKIKFRPKPRSGLPSLYLGFYRDLIVYDHLRNEYILVANIRSHKTKADRRFRCEAARRIQRLKKCFDPPRDAGISRRKSGKPFRLKEFCPEISQPQFEHMVRRAQRYIVAGDIYQANLSQRFSFKFEGCPTRLYDTLRKINPSPFASFLKVGDLRILSSSPERLIRKRGRLCETRPIAGTRPRFSPKMTSRTLVQDLLRSEKERAEHIMLVDLERNDLGRVCDWSTVRVEEMMKIEKYSHVIHIVSKIVGRLSNNKDLFDLIQAMFPGGTITGCPKIRCIEIIDELEPVQRGIYTGSIGYIDFRGDLDLNIVIRTMILKKNKGYLQVGAGIVYDSDPTREFDETLHKGEALVKALAESSAE